MPIPYWRVWSRGLEWEAMAIMQEKLEKEMHSEQPEKSLNQQTPWSWSCGIQNGWTHEAKPDLRPTDEDQNLCGFKSLEASLVAQMVKNLPTVQETEVGSLDREDPLEKELATHSSVLAWRTPWTEGPGGLQSMGLHMTEWLTLSLFTICAGSSAT